MKAKCKPLDALLRKGYVSGEYPPKKPEKNETDCNFDSNRGMV